MSIKQSALPHPIKLAKREYVISTKNLNNVDNLIINKENAYIINSIKDYLSSKFGDDVHFGFISNDNITQSILINDFSRGDIDYLTHILDIVPTNGIYDYLTDKVTGEEYTNDAPVEERSIGTTGDVRFGYVEPAVYTNVLYYCPKFDIVVGIVWIPRNPGAYDHEFMVFFKDDASLVAYRKYIKDERAIRGKGKINIIIDGPHGGSRKIVPITDIVSREEVLLDEDLKREIFRSVDQFFEDGGSFYKKYNIPYRRGILLFGHPGNGKTTLLRSVVSTIDIPVFYWQVTEFTSSSSIAEIFAMVKDDNPDKSSLLVIEDIDSLPASCRSIFLNYLDGVNTTEGIFIIGTTNYPDKIDKALNRAGRFDRQFEIKYPSDSIRRQYLMNKGIDAFLSESQIDSVIKGTEKMPMAMLNEIYVSSALHFHYDGKVNISVIMEHLNEMNKKQLSKDFYSNDRPNVGFTAEARDPSINGNR